MLADLPDVKEYLAMTLDQQEKVKMQLALLKGLAEKLSKEEYASLDFATAEALMSLQPENQLELPEETEAPGNSLATTNWYSAEADSFTLNTASELLGLAELVKGGNDFSGKTVKLGGKIDLSSVCGADKGNWLPIGTAAHPFAGTFDGQKNTVRNLYYQEDKAAVHDVGRDCRFRCTLSQA